MEKIHELINNGTIPAATGVFRGSDDMVNTMVEDYVFGATGIDALSEYKLLFGTVIPYWKVSIIDKHKGEEEPHYRIVLKKGTVSSTCSTLSRITATIGLICIMIQRKWTAKNGKVMVSIRNSVSSWFQCGCL